MRNSLWTILATLVFAAAARADRVVLVAGGGDKGEGAPAAEARLNSPFGVDFDAAGNLYFVEIDGHRVCRIDDRASLRESPAPAVKATAATVARRWRPSSTPCTTWRSRKPATSIWPTRSTSRPQDRRQNRADFDGRRQRKRLCRRRRPGDESQVQRHLLRQPRSGQRAALSG